MNQEPGGAVARRDEVLQLLYWLEGEGFDQDARVEGLTRFLGWPEDEVRTTLMRLLDLGEIALAQNGEYRLTPPGRDEAARRFLEEFAPMLAQGHGECSDPECDCHGDPDRAVACRSGRQAPQT